jgi:hypothetical protein
VDIKASSVRWTEPNRAKTPPLHIASSGQRYSTLTGVWWLNEHLFVVNHRSGLRLALFDCRAPGRPLTTAAIPHLTDDIAALQVGDNQWEVAVSGCWAAEFSLFLLTFAEQSRFQFIRTQQHQDHTFCHGIGYGSGGVRTLAFHTGNNPRIIIGDTTWKLPQPWGARALTFDEPSGHYYAVAVSENPKRSSYGSTKTSLWALTRGSERWQMTHVFDDIHADSCSTFKGRLWFPDQKGDRVLGVCLSGRRAVTTLRSQSFDFPHGLSISSQGQLAVTNYGSSAVSLIDISEIE